VEPDPVDRGPAPGYFVTDPQPPQDALAGGRDRHPGPDLAEAGRLFVHVSLRPDASQRQGGREAADSAANDHHAYWFH
jgi:hypothetical protein